MKHTEYIKLGIGILACLLLPGALSEAALRAPVREHAPYEYVDDHDKADGVIPALLREVGRRLGEEVEFIPVSPTGALQGMGHGRLNVAVLGRTEERLKDYWFSPTLFYYRFVVLTAPRNEAVIDALPDLAGRTVAVQTGSTEETILGRYPRVNRVSVPDYATGIRVVADGNADFFLGDREVSLFLIESGKAPYLKPAGPDVVRVPACFAVVRTRADLADAIASVHHHMRRDGTLERIKSAWLGREFRAPKPEPWIVQHQRIVVLVAVATLAFLVLFIVALQLLVKQRTRRLEAAQKSLRMSEDRYRQLFTVSNDAIIVFGLDGLIRECNERVYQLYGYRPAELLGQQAAILLPAEADDSFAEKVAALKQEGSHIYESRHKRKDGELIDVELSERMIPWENGKAIMSCVRDVTARKRAEAALRESQESLARAQRMEMAGIIAGQIAHDFNNLLSPMVAFPAYVKKELPESSPAHLDLELIQVAANRIADINQQLLTLSRRGHYRQKPLDLNGVIKEALDTVFHRNPANIQIKTDCDPRLQRVRGGASQLLRALTNIFMNALEAMGEQGTLHVKTENVYLDLPLKGYETIEVGEYVKVTIRDDGCGMSAEVRARMFEPFYTTKKVARDRGAGLGLSVVHGVVKDHQGYIDIESEEEKGTTIMLYFPGCLDEIEVEDDQTVSGGSERILVVDDDPLQIFVCKRVLEHLGYRVEGVLSGEEAVERLQEENFDLVVLDMVMENGIDGAETFKRILDFKPGQHAILVSGYAESDRVELAQELGAGAFYRKPLTTRGLAQAVRTELDKAKR